MANQQQRATDPQGESTHLAATIDRQKDLVTPVSNLIQLLSRRVYAAVAVSILAYVQISALTLIVWLSAMQRIWGFPTVTFTVVATIAVVLNVAGLPVLVWALRRVR